MKPFRLFIFSLLLSSTIFSCKKADKSAVLRLNLSHEIDGAAIISDSIMYVNAAGFTYSITNLKYYISEVVLTEDDNSTQTFEGPFYVDLANASTHSYDLENLTVSTYKTIRFYIGLDAAHNLNNSLPATSINNNMAWPEPMGGGYHFMKLEGYYFNPSPTETGFAMHLGKNANLVTCTINNLALETSESGSDLNLVMNVNEWFRNPAIYDFNSDGVSIMANDATMLKLSQNGVDVFSKK